MNSASKSPLGFRRNWVWRTIQVTLQIIFVLVFRYRCQGKERYPKDSGALLVINHQSYLDPLLVGLPLKRPVSFLARDSLFRVPVIGWILRNTYVMPINREAAGPEGIRQAVARMQDGYLVGIFPEGTRSTSEEIGTIKPGFIALARRVKMPMIPVGISGAYRAMPRGSLFLHKTEVSIYIGEPLDPDRVSELTSRGREEEFVQYIREQLEFCNQQARLMQFPQ